MAPPTEPQPPPPYLRLHPLPIAPCLQRSARPHPLPAVPRVRRDLCWHLAALPGARHWPSSTPPAPAAPAVREGWEHSHVLQPPATAPPLGPQEGRKSGGSCWDRAEGGQGWGSASLLPHGPSSCHCVLHRRGARCRCPPVPVPGPGAAGPVAGSPLPAAPGC